jgi:hypothetical protein
MYRKPSSRRINFITGITENYFLMCCVLMESLDRYFPRIPFHVMDFGLSAGQQEFFRQRDMLLPMPAGLVKGDHPFKLKSRTGDYLPEDFGVPIWIDADVIAVSDGTQAVLELVEDMIAKDQRFALAPDQGTPGAGPQSLRGNSHETLTPTLCGFVREHPDLAHLSYLNTGVVVFREADRMGDWRTSAEQFEGDMVWEQNAFNAVCYLGTKPLRILEPRVWNVHSGLLDLISGDARNIACDGERSIFVHATSPDTRQVTWGEIEFVVAGSRYKNFVKLFNHPVLGELQKNYMNDFLGANLSQLREFGILSGP